MLKKDEKSTKKIRDVLSMPDSDEKLKALCNLQLEAEPLTPLHTKLLDEGNRLINAGFSMF